MTTYTAEDIERYLCNIGYSQDLLATNPEEMKPGIQLLPHRVGDTVENSQLSLDNVPETVQDSQFLPDCAVATTQHSKAQHAPKPSGNQPSVLVTTPSPIKKCHRHGCKLRGDLLKCCALGCERLLHKECYKLMCPFKF